MTTPAVVEVDGSGQRATTWVMKVTQFASTPMHRAALAVACEGKPFHIAMVRQTKHNDMYLLIHQPTPISGSNVKQNVQTVMIRSRVQMICEAAQVFNIFHAELFGLRDMPVGSPPEEEYYSSDGEEGDAIFRTCRSMDEVETRMGEFRKKRELEKMEIMRLNERPSIVAVPGTAEHGPGLQTPLAEFLWLNLPPAELQMCTSRRMSETTKLDFVLQRLGHAGVVVEPVPATFVSFYAVYKEVSGIKDAVKLEKQAFETFNVWVEKTTGVKLLKDSLPQDEVLKVRNGKAVPGKCLKCQASFEVGLEPHWHAGNIYQRPKNPFGEYCSKKCAGRDGDFRLRLTPFCHIYPDGMHY